MQNIQNVPEYSVQAMTITSLLAPQNSAFKVPVFQRSYAWGAPEVGQLVEDLYGSDTWWTERPSDPPYFMGSIVLARDEEGGRALNILDGQQRLTTLSLMLATLAQKLTEESKKVDTDTSQRLADRIIVIKQHIMSAPGMDLAEGPTPKITLQPDDSALYAQLIGNPGAVAAPARKKHLVVATSKITQMLDERLDKAQVAGQVRHNAILAMTNKLLERVVFVRIVAPSEEAAFQLFETLNDRGLTLSAADLIKNKLFAKCATVPRHYEAIRDIWGDIVEQATAADLVNFLRYYWIAYKGEVTKQSLYKAFRESIRGLDAEQTVTMAREIQLAAEFYRTIARPDPSTSDTARTLERLNNYGARSYRPALLACHAKNLAFLPRLIQICESVIVRHTIVGDRSPAQLEKAYAALCRSLREDPTRITQTVQQELYKYTPNDQEFDSQFTNLIVDDDTTTWRQILARLDAELGTGEYRVEGPRAVHVEHILPQKPSDEALREAGLQGTSKEELQPMIWRIGNLTLLSGPKNQSASNKPFSDKRLLYETSQIALNKSLAEKTAWNLDEIDSRSQELATLAVQAWPLL